MTSNHLYQLELCRCTIIDQKEKDLTKKESPKSERNGLNCTSSFTIPSNVLLLPLPGYPHKGQKSCISCSNLVRLLLRVQLCNTSLLFLLLTRAFLLGLYSPPEFNTISSRPFVHEVLTDIC